MEKDAQDRASFLACFMNNQAKPPHLRPYGYTTKTGERKELILEVLRKSLVPMTRQEIEQALGWPEHALFRNKNKCMDPIMLLIEEGRVGRLREGRERRYYSDPYISTLIVKE